MNHDERPLMKGDFTVDRHSDSPFVDRNFIRKLFSCCCHGSDEFPSWDDKLKGSVRRGRELSDSLANEVALNWSRKEKKLKVFFRRIRKSNRKSVYCDIQTKSARFQYDPDSYALNFDEGSLEEDGHSLRSFSARFAAPVAKPWETLQS
ncbi:hypothetical protein SUGI_0897970 [Cryptomeria japonica]|nr:hypothetical protein SUGI_0897970 [Cryptomeria japonica]